MQEVSGRLPGAGRSARGNLPRSYGWLVPVRLSAIAERAGVSASTVSRVLNDRPGVHKRTRQRVLTAIDVLGYDRPYRLRPRATGLVGLLIPELENPFFPRLAKLVEAHLTRAGFALVLCSQTVDGTHEDEYVQMLVEHGVSGIIFVSGVHALVDSNPERYARLADMGMPFVCINGGVPGVAAPFLSTDDTTSVELGLNHLFQMGHQRLGIALGQPIYVPVRRRAAAFRNWLEQHDLKPEGLEVEDLIECTEYSVEGGVVAAERLLGRGVTGILCGSDVMALGVLRAARRAALRVPQDLSIIGNDDSMLMENTDPPLTTVRQPAAALAEAACRELMDQMSGKLAREGEVLYQPELIVRGSSGRAA